MATIGMGMVAIAFACILHSISVLVMYAFGHGCNASSLLQEISRCLGYGYGHGCNYFACVLHDASGQLVYQQWAKKLNVFSMSRFSDLDKKTELVSDRFSNVLHIVHYTNAYAWQQQTIKT